MKTTRQPPFKRPDMLEEVYRWRIQKLIDDYFVTPSFTTLGEINTRLVEYAQAQSFFDALVTRLATRMITQTAFLNARSWREAAAQSSNGRYIYEMLRSDLTGHVGLQVRNLVLENSKLIKTVPQRVALRVSNFAYNEFTKGVRSETIIKNLRPYMEKAKTWEIRRLARTEVAKADTAITRARAEDVGAMWYIWRASRDARVRKSHKNMDGVLINWGSTPAPELLVREKSQGHYDAGNIYNCRCIALPLIRLDQVKWPSRVYYAGRIQVFSERQFAMLTGMPLRLAA